MKKRQKAELRKPDILKNYYEVILEEGVEGASIAKVAKRMDIHPSLIIHYFDNKDNMTVGLVDHISKNYRELFMKLRIETDDPEKRFERLIDIFCSDEWYNNTDISGDFSVIAVSFRNTNVFSSVQLLYREFIDLIVKELEVIIESGLLKISDSQRAAQLIVSMIEGYRHFKHFYIDEINMERHRQDLINAMKILLNSGQY